MMLMILRGIMNTIMWYIKYVYLLKSLIRCVYVYICVIRFFVCVSERDHRNMFIYTHVLLRQLRVLWKYINAHESVCTKVVKTFFQYFQVNQSFMILLEFIEYHVFNIFKKINTKEKGTCCGPFVLNL